MKPAQGWDDWPFFRLKYRLASANETQGNYIVTALVQFGAPTGINAFTSHAYTVAPALAVGKGRGDFDVQSIVSVLMTVGAVVGRIKLVDRTSLTLGLGYQFTISPKAELVPALVPTIRNAIYSSARLNF